MKEYECMYCGTIFKENENLKPIVNNVLKNWRKASFKDVFFAIVMKMNFQLGSKTICPNCRSNNVELTEKSKKILERKEKLEEINEN